MLGTTPSLPLSASGACRGCERWGVKIVRVRMSVTEYRNTEIDLLFLVLPYRRGGHRENINRGFNFCISVSSHVTKQKNRRHKIEKHKLKKVTSFVN